MKKLFISAMAAVAILASCSNSIDLDTSVTNLADGPQVQLSLGADAGTRAFFDDAAATEAWENEIKTMTVYVFGNSGRLILKRMFTRSEVEAKSASFSLPGSAAGTACSFYVVANADYGNVATSSAMDAMTESATLGEYNGTFAEVSTGSKRAAGFVMTGKATAAIAAAGSPTTVQVSVKRTVAKIAVRTKMADDFSVRYGGGTVTINSVKISKASPLSNSFYKASYASRTTLYETSQNVGTSGGYYNSLFYIYENGPLTSANRLVLTFTGYFDTDGLASTTADRSDVEYTATLAGNSDNGEISRNGYYRVDAVINGISGSVIGITLRLEEWATPVTQYVTLGQ